MSGENLENYVIQQTSINNTENACHTSDALFHRFGEQPTSTNLYLHCTRSKFLEQTIEQGFSLITTLLSVEGLNTQNVNSCNVNYT